MVDPFFRIFLAFLFFKNKAEKLFLQVDLLKSFIFT